MSVPSVPLIFKRPDAIDQALLFFWEPPVSDGGSPVTSYFLTDGTLSYTIPVTQLSYQVSGLTNGTSYSFSLAASNANGLGPAEYYRTVQPGFVPSTIPFVSSMLTSGTNYDIVWQRPNSDASILGYICKAHVVDSNLSTIFDSVSTITKARNNNAVLNQNFTVTSTINWRFGVYGVNDPGYSPVAFSSTIINVGDPKGSMFFDGTVGLNTSTIGLSMGDAPFTITWWQYSFGSNFSFRNMSSTYYNLAVYTEPTKIRVFWNNISTVIDYVNPTGAWHHFVLQKYIQPPLNLVSLFVDGINIPPTPIAVGPLIMNGNFEIGPGLFGYITNFSFIAGTALYDSSYYLPDFKKSFVPPRINFSSVEASQMLLLSRTSEYTYTDSSLLKRTFTPIDTTTQSTSYLFWSNIVPSAYPYGSLYFNNQSPGTSPSRIEFQNTDSSLLSSNAPFSIQFSIYFKTLYSTVSSGSFSLFNIGGSEPSSRDLFRFVFGNGGIGSNVNSTFISFVGSSVSTTVNLGANFFRENEWNHCIIERAGNFLFLGKVTTSSIPFATMTRIGPLSFSFPSSISSLWLTGGFNGALTNFSWYNGDAPYVSTYGSTIPFSYPSTPNITRPFVGQLFMQVFDSNNPYYDYSYKVRSTIAYGSDFFYSTMNPFSNYSY